MNNHARLRQLAITAAKQADWDLAIRHNTDILDQKPNDPSALNRLGVAYLQTKQYSKASSAFKKALEIDANNSIAKKHLAKIKSKQIVNAPSFSFQPFIEEPGKTKTVDLHRLAGKQVLENLAVGQECELKIKKRYISVEIARQYIGALPEDLSCRLAKLIERGNTYSCTIRSCSNKTCSVYLREISRSAQNSEIHSFPPTKHSATSYQEFDDRFLLLDEDIPVEMGNNENDSNIENTELN